METGKVKQVTAVNSQGSSFIRVGDDGVTHIEEYNFEDERGTIHLEYVAYRGEDKYKAFINLPVQVEYYS